MKFVTQKGITTTGNKVNIMDRALCDRIRKRLNLTSKELPDNDIRKVVRLSNIEIGKWILNNPEGYMLDIGFESKKQMGAICCSKHLPKEFRDTKEQTLEKIDSLNVSELFRKQILKRYDVDIGRVIDFNKLRTLKEKIPHLDLSTYFYSYKIMWFNHRNCKSKKAKSYVFKAMRDLGRGMMENVLSGKDYYEWNFNDFYVFKMKSEF